MDSEAIGGTGTSKDGWKREKERKKKSWKKFLSPKISKTGFWWWPVGGCDGKPRLSSGESPAKFRKSTFSYSYCPEHPLLSYIGKRLSRKKKLKNFLSPKISKTGFWWWPGGSWAGGPAWAQVNVRQKFGNRLFRTVTARNIHYFPI
jgi:hypothetical protein